MSSCPRVEASEVDCFAHPAKQDRIAFRDGPPHTDDRHAIGRQKHGESAAVTAPVQLDRSRHRPALTDTFESCLVQRLGPNLCRNGNGLDNRSGTRLDARIEKLVEVEAADVTRQCRQEMLRGRDRIAGAQP